MMAKRRSIGSDPLDWIGEPAAMAAPDASPGASIDGEAASAAGSDPAFAPSTSLAPAVPAFPGTLGPVDGSATSYTLERQLLLVDGMLRDGVPRPRLNQTLWVLLFLLTFLGTAILLFQEARRQWGARVVTLEGTIDRMEKEKGQSVRVLEQVIVEKDGLIREKQGTISRIESLHQTLTEELHLARAESRELKVQNQELIDRVLKPHRDPTPAPEGRAAGKPSDQVRQDSEK